jgi:hypothetical protein
MSSAANGSVVCNVSPTPTLSTKPRQGHLKLLDFPLLSSRIVV